MSQRDHTTTTPATDEAGGGEPAHRTVLDLVEGIRTGAIDAGGLSVSERQACVNHLRFEGASTSAMAKLLKRSEKTIERDRAALDEAAALTADPRTTARLVGRLLGEADTCVQRIRRATREKDCPHAERIEGERVCFEITSILIQRMQGLGILPTASHRVEASVTHRAGGIPSFEELGAEVRRVRAALPPGSPEASEMEEMDVLVMRARVATRVQEVSGVIDQAAGPSPEVRDGDGA